MHRVVIHFHEVALKGKNRGFFEKKLLDNLHYALSDYRVHAIRNMSSRYLVEIDAPKGEEFDWGEVQDRLSRVFGVANFSRTHLVEEGDIEDLSKQVFAEVEKLPRQSFVVRAKRSVKQYPLTSPQIERTVGTYIYDRLEWPVDLHTPDLRVQIEMLNKRGKALFHLEKIEGAGGLPVGANEPTACLMSGGIDSPVAAYRMLRRGCSVWFIHFHSFPYTNQASIDKVRDTVEILSRHRFRPRVIMVPLADIQREIVAKTPAEFRVLLYRRFMLRIAERLAHQYELKALVTGDSVGQVASQTISNLGAIQQAVKIPVLRPLVGMDKQEIIDTARKIGTFEISTEPHDDCCSYLMPRSPRTHSTAEELEAAEESLDVEDLIHQGVEGVEFERGDEEE